MFLFASLKIKYFKTKKIVKTTHQIIHCVMNKLQNLKSIFRLNI